MGERFQTSISKPRILKHHIPEHPNPGEPPRRAAVCFRCLKQYVIIVAVVFWKQLVPSPKPYVKQLYYTHADCVSTLIRCPGEPPRRAAGLRPAAGGRRLMSIMIMIIMIMIIMIMIIIITILILIQLIMIAIT